MKQTLTDLIMAAYQRAVDAGELPQGQPVNWRLDHPKNPEHGDYAANIAMILAKPAKKPPRAVAEILLKYLGDGDGSIQHAEIAGPGFINIRMAPGLWQRVVRQVFESGAEYGKSSVGGGKKVQVEFVSANPTGPLHVGHGRGAVVGDVLGRVMDAAGFEVQREYYINDAGNQIETLGGSVYLRYLQLLGREVEFPDNFYQGDYITKMARVAMDNEGERYAEMDKDAAINELGAKAGSEILAEIRGDLENFGIVFDCWFSERSLFDSGEVARVLKELEESGAAYREEGALWLRTSEHGDEKDRVLVRGDGRETYFASDIAYHLDKYRRGFEQLVDVWGADHHGYVPRMKAALKTVGRDPESFNVLMVQLVNLMRGGKPVNMSTRAGEFVTLDEVVKEVGADAARFIFLTRSSDSALDFDLELAKRQTSDNPVFYVQYANARICSVYKGADEAKVPHPDPATVDLSPLTLPEEVELMKLIHLFPDVVEGAALQREPHRLAYYLQELAAKFHQYYNKHRFLIEDKKLTAARLALIGAVRTVLVNGLAIMGVSAPEAM